MTCMASSPNMINSVMFQITPLSFMMITQTITWYDYTRASSQVRTTSEARNSIC